MNQAETPFMLLQQQHIDALDQAERLIFHSDFCPYLELKKLLLDPTPLAQDRFRLLFTNYYGLNIGGLTEEFKIRFFTILFSGKFIANGQPDFASILWELSRIKRKKGDFVIPFSFTSKLVAMHDETSPIYDRHVLNFFSKKAPAATVDKQNRIAWYVEFLQYVRNTYINWAGSIQVAPILSRLKIRDVQLSNCHIVRLMDFLVWKVGNQKLLRT